MMAIVMSGIPLNALSAEPIWADLGARYALFRRVVPMNVAVQSARILVTAVQSGRMEKLLGAYRLYVNGAAIGIGPGRGDVRTAAYSDGGDRNFTFYDTFNVTAQATSIAAPAPLTLGLQCYHGTGDASAGVLLELHLVFPNGSTSVVRTSSTDGHWRVFDATAGYGPKDATGGYGAPQEWAVSGLLPSGWTRASYALTSGWRTPATRNGTTPSLDVGVLRAKPTLPLHIATGVVPMSLRQLSGGGWFADFGREMMGGLTLHLPEADFPVGSALQVTLGEELVGDRSVSTDILYPMRTGNRYRNVWTVSASPADGVTAFEHHEYMVFRYARIELAPHYNSTATCAEVDEAPSGHEPARITLHCPTHVTGEGVIDEVRFASYGTPSGSCDASGGGNFTIDATCHAAHSAKAVADACVGKNQCALEASNGAFGGDPCHLTPKRLAVVVSCKKAAASSPLARAPPPTIDVSAWQVRYPWRDDDSRFASSNDTLNAVWRLARDTLQATSLDTATDSNTRERLPYEADGYITGLSRLALQAEFAWPRHSWVHNIQNPTWPTEWRQTTPLMALGDYLATGELSLFSRFASQLVAQTQIACVNSTSGLIDFRRCPRQAAGLGAGSEASLRDIVDWPPISRDGYVLSDTANTVVNAYAVGGLGCVRSRSCPTRAATRAVRRRSPPRPIRSRGRSTSCCGTACRASTAMGSMRKARRSTTRRGTLPSSPRLSASSRRGGGRRCSLSSAGAEWWGASTRASTFWVRGGLKQTPPRGSVTTTL